MLRTLLVTTLLAAAATAQCNSTLAVTGTGAAGTDLEFAVTGAQADTNAVIFVGETAGSTTLNFGPLGSLTLGLDLPFAPVAFGATDSNGDFSQTITLPPNLPMQVSLSAQATSVDLAIGQGAPSLEFCPSNVASFSIGN